MTLEDLDVFISAQTQVVTGPSDQEPDLATVFTSGGDKEDVWCESEAKAIELFAYEFANFAKAHEDRAICFLNKPEMLIWPVFTKTTRPMMDKHDLYCVSAHFFVMDKAQEEQDDAVDLI